MRIIRGKLKGRSLFYDKNPFLRPTQDKVKEAIFNILQFEIEGKTVLDLFCGTGSLGLEALSQGAKKVVFVDKNIKILQKNIETLNLKQIEIGAFEVKKQDPFQYIKKTAKKFDIILMDPPYDDISLYKATLNAMMEFDILASSGLIICEHYKKFSIIENEHNKTDTRINDKLIQIKQYPHGDTIISVLKRIKNN